MIRSVSMSRPTQTALPSPYISRLRHRDLPAEGRDPRGGHRGKEDLSPDPHPVREVAVRRGQADLPLPEDPHVGPEARPAPRNSDDAAGRQQDLHDPLPGRLPEDPLRCRDHDGPDPHLLSLEDPGEALQVLEPAVRAGADEYLVDVRPCHGGHLLHPVYPVMARDQGW